MKFIRVARNIARKSLRGLYIQKEGVYRPPIEDATLGFDVSDWEVKGKLYHLFLKDDVRSQLESLGLEGHDVLHTYLTNPKAWELTPHPLFDGGWYFETHPDVRGKMNPLDHYLTWGFREGRNPNPLFNEKWYRSKYDVGNDTPCLIHYVLQSEDFKSWPNGIFDSSFYGQNYPVSLSKHLTPLGHYLRIGHRGPFNPHPFFDNVWYVERYLSGKDALQMNPLEHYIRWGAGLCLDPSPKFDAKGFKARYSREIREDHNVLAFYSEKARRGIFLETEGSGFLPTEQLFSASLSRYLEKRKSKEEKPLLRSSVPLSSVIDHVESGGGFLLTEVKRERKPLTPPKFLGERDAPFETGHVEFPSCYVAELRDILCKGGSRLILPKPFNQILHDAYAQRDPFAESKDADVYLEEGHLRLTPALFSKYFNGAIHLMNEYSANYFHWVTEVLPRIMLLKEIDTKGYPVLIQSGLHENLKELLDVVTEGKFQFIEIESSEWIYVSELIYPSDVCRVSDILKREARPGDQAVHSSQLAEVRNLVVQRYARPSGYEGKVVYMRRRSGARRIVNEQELISEFRNAGVEIIDSDGLSIQQQIDVFHSARTIIAPTGAILTNILWSNPETSVICLISDHQAMNPQIWQQLADISSAKLKYFCGPRTHTITGTYSIHDDFRINTDRLFSLLNEDSVI